MISKLFRTTCSPPPSVGFHSRGCGELEGVPTPGSWRFPGPGAGAFPRRHLSFLPFTAAFLRRTVADASAVINLAASGAVSEIALVLPAPIRMAKAVALELENGRPRWTTSDDMAELASAGIIEIVDLVDAAGKHLEALSVGAASETLDDGGAATIAYAVTSDLKALIYERKACQILIERYAALAVTTT